MSCLGAPSRHASFICRAYGLQLAVAENDVDDVDDVALVSDVAVVCEVTGAARQRDDVHGAWLSGQVGANLARLELAEALAVMTRRMPMPAARVRPRGSR